VTGRKFAVMQQMLRSGDPSTDLDWASTAGATGIGVHAPSFGGRDPATIRAMVGSRGLTLSSVEGLAPLTLGDGTPADAEQVIDHWAAAGAGNLLVGVGPLRGRSFAEADAEVHRALRRLAPRALERRVRLVVEPIHPVFSETTFVHTLRHAADLVAPHPGAGIVVDLAHLYWDRHFYDDLVHAAALIGAVQIADVDAAALADYSYRRCQLGQGVVPLAEMVAAVDAVGYRGFFEFESIRSLPKSERVEFVAQGRDWLDAL
jgi:sugar phosphate isomerase/epimerase